MILTSKMELSRFVLSGDSSRRWRRMCFRALWTMLETDSLEIGTAAAGSVSFDKAELISAFSAKVKKTHNLSSHEALFILRPQNNIYQDRIFFRTHVSDGTTKWRLQWNHVADVQKQRREELSWPLPSSSISPLPRISSVDSLVEPSFKNSVKISPVWGEGGESEKCWRRLEQVLKKVAGFSGDNVALLCSQTGFAGIWLNTAVCSGSTALMCQ